MNIKTCAIIFLLLSAVSAPLFGQGLLYFSENETGWFTAGQYVGNIHTNAAENTFQFHDLPVWIRGRLLTSADNLIFAEGITLDDLELDNEPTFNAPPNRFPQNAGNIRNNANPWISDQNGQFMTRVVMDEGNILFYQHPHGSPAGDSLILSIRAPAWGCIFIDGQCEISGWVTGKYTIGSSGDMWLVDDITYVGANRRNGRFGDGRREMEGFPHMLGLVSERNIIIKNTYRNGREDGYNAQPGNPARHSIVIDAGPIALGGSFMFQHTNADWEAYQGPEPDERGIIHLTGTVVQRDGFALHNDNHEGTGYFFADYLYDYRFDVRPPPFFPIELYGDEVTIYIFLRKYQFPIDRIAVVTENDEGDNLLGQPGGEIRYLGPYTVDVSSEINITGSPDEPFLITFPDYIRISRGVLRMINGGQGIVKLKHVNVAEGVEMYFESDSIQIDSCMFVGPVFFRGNYVKVSNSHFTDDVQLGGWTHNIFERNVVEGSISVSGDPRFLTITNNTIVNGDGDAIVLDTYRNADIRNNIITGFERGIVNDHWNEPTLEYNDVWCDEGYVDCGPGAGSISINPRYIDPGSGDYRLAWNSPCIDVGDPDEPADPDGTRSDIGAFPFDQRLSVSKEMPIPQLFSITASPNPFNRTTILHVTNMGESVSVTVYDLMGREVVSLVETLSNRVTLDGALFSGAGVYFARVEMSDRVETVKLVYLP